MQASQQKESKISLFENDCVFRGQFCPRNVHERWPFNTRLPVGESRVLSCLFFFGGGGG